MDRRARVVKRPRTARSFHSGKTPFIRGSKVSVRIAGHSGVQDVEHDFEQAVLNQAREVLVELFDLLEEYGPAWYTDTHRSRALAAIRALQGS